MITGRDIVFISSIEWDFLWQVHQEIASQLAAAGNRIFYVENTGVRRPRLADAKRVGHRLSRWSRSLLSRDVRQVSPNIFVLSPIVMPPFGPPVNRLLNRRLFLRLIKRTAARIGIRDPLIWTYLPTDTALDLIQILRTDASAVVYYCGADFALLTKRRGECRRTEDELIKLSDLIFATCDQLEQKCRRLNSNVHRIPALVDLKLFSLTASTEDDAAAGARRISSSTAARRPVIGYAGGLHRHMDYDLLVAMAQARPDWSWVFVGSRNTDVRALLAQPNVTLLGQRPHDELVEYLRTFDVCIVPYLNTDITATVVPMKINEYLAMGKPVVATALPAICVFNDQHKVISIASNECASFLAAIESALNAPNSREAINHRREVAQLGDSRAFLDSIGSRIQLKADPA